MRKKHVQLLLLYLFKFIGSGQSATESFQGQLRHHTCSQCDQDLAAQFGTINHSVEYKLLPLKVLGMFCMFFSKITEDQYVIIVNKHKFRHSRQGVLPSARNFGRLKHPLHDCPETGRGMDMLKEKNPELVMPKKASSKVLGLSDFCNSIWRKAETCTGSDAVQVLSALQVFREIINTMWIALYYCKLIQSNMVNGVGHCL